MALSNLRSNRKLKRLAATLGVTEQLAVGLLEYLWWAVYDGTTGSIGPDGRLVGWTIDDIANCAGWPANANQGLMQDQTNDDFVQALCDAGFLDRLTPNLPGQRPPTADAEFAIHDLKDHAPGYVRKRWARQRPEQQNRPTVSENKGALDNGGQRPPTADIGRQRPPTKGREGKGNQTAAAETSPISSSAPQPDGSAAAVKKRELKKELNRQGIDAPTDAILAEEFSGATVAAVRKALANVSPSAGAGVRVTVLRDKLGKPEPVEKPNTFHDVPAVDPDLLRIRAWLETLEEELAEEYSVDKDEIDATFKLLDTPAREHLRKLATWAVARRLDALPGSTGGLARKVGHAELQKTILLWGFSSTDRAWAAYMGLAFPIIASNKHLSAIVADAKATKDACSSDTKGAPSDANEKPVVLDVSKSEASQGAEDAV